MKFVKLFAVAVIATVAFASCGGGASTENADTTAVVAVDSTPVVIDTTVVVDTTAVDTAVVK